MSVNMYRTGSPLQAAGCLLFGIVFMVGLVFFFQLAFKFLAWACIGFFVLALIIDYTVVMDTGRWFVNTLRTDPLRGIVYGALGFFGFPVLAFGWFLMALAKNKIKSVASRYEEDFRRMGGEGPNPFMTETPRKDDYVDYEEIETKKKDS